MSKRLRFLPTGSDAVLVELEDPSAVTAPIVGTLQRWLVKADEHVGEGETAARVQAMRTETRVFAPKVGRIRITKEAVCQ